MPDFLEVITTASTQEEAMRIAESLVTARLAGCVQIDGPLHSYYLWQGKQERSREYRLTIKFLRTQKKPLEKYLLENHPYETPEWVVVRAEDVAEKYLSWARSNGTSAPL